MTNWHTLGSVHQKGYRRRRSRASGRIVGRATGRCARPRSGIRSDLHRLPWHGPRDAADLHAGRPTVRRRLQRLGRIRRVRDRHRPQGARGRRRHDASLRLHCASPERRPRDARRARSRAGRPRDLACRDRQLDPPRRPSGRQARVRGRNGHPGPFQRDLGETRGGEGGHRPSCAPQGHGPSAGTRTGRTGAAQQRQPILPVPREASCAAR